nr:hypothetical protein [Tanacetum cinerariifolium]
EPASSTGTLSSLQHLAKDLRFGDLFFNDKPSEADNEKTTMETEAKLMVSVTIQQDTSVIPPITTPIIDLTSRPDSLNVHRPLQATETKTITTTTTIHPPLPQPQQSTTDSMLMKHIGELEHIMANLIQDNKHLEERLDSHGAHLYILENLDIPQQETNSYKTHEDHMMLYESLEKSMNRDPTEELLKDLVETATSAEYKAWTMTDTRLKLSISPTPKDLQMDDDMAPDAQAHSSDDEDIRNVHILKASTLASTYSPPPEDSLLAQTGDMAMFMDWFCKRQEITKLKPQDLKGPTFELVKVFHPNSKWCPARCGLKRSASMILLLCMVFLTGGSKDNDSTLTDIFEGDRRAVRTHMRILSVVRIEVFSMYGYDYMKNIVLRRADLNEHIIAKRDFKYLYPSDFKDLYVLNLQGFEYKHDYMVINSPRAITFRDKYGVQMIMQINEIHKFSDSTLHQIDKALDYQVTVCSSLRSLKPKRIIESKAKRSSKKNSLGHYFIMLASSHTVKSKTDIKSPTYYPRGLNSLVHSFRTLSTLRRSGLRMVSAAVKPCQGDSSKLYLITGRIPMVVAAGQRDVNSQPHAHTSNSVLMT